MTIREFIAETLGVDVATISAETRMKDVEQWDSLKHMTLILALEKEYALHLTGDEIADMTSIQAIEATIGKHTA